MDTVNIRKHLEAAYLDYTNDYLTIELYAEHNGLTIEDVRNILKVGKYIHEGNHPDM